MNWLKFIFTSHKLDAEVKKEFDLELGLRTIFNMRFVSLIVIVIIILFAGVDFYTIKDARVLHGLALFRAGFILMFLTPFAIFFFLNRKPVMQHVIFVNALAYAFFLFALSFIVRYNTRAIFHVTIGLFVLNIGVHVLLGLKRKYALIISGLIFFMVNSNYNQLARAHSMDINALDVNLWFVIITTVSVLLGWHLEVIYKNTFVINYKLKQANQSRYGLFNIVSHDLKNIISAQATITDYLQTSDSRLDDKERTNLLGLLNKSSNDALAMFSDLMIWVKSQMDIIKPVVSQINFENFVHSQVEQFKMITENKNIKINVENIDLLGIETDGTILSLVFRNILGNAIKYSKQGSTIDIVAHKKPYGFQMQIIDHGVGIDKNKLENIFNVDNRNSTNGTVGEKGTGMGLFLTKDLLSHIHGKINIQSKVGIGTKVIVDVPDFSEVLN